MLLWASAECYFPPYHVATCTHGCGMQQGVHECDLRAVCSRAPVYVQITHCTQFSSTAWLLWRCNFTRTIRCGVDNYCKSRTLQRVRVALLPGSPKHGWRLWCTWSSKQKRCATVHTYYLGLQQTYQQEAIKNRQW